MQDVIEVLEAEHEDDPKAPDVLHELASFMGDGASAASAQTSGFPTTIATEARHGSNQETVAFRRHLEAAQSLTASQRASRIQSRTASQRASCRPTREELDFPVVTPQVLPLGVPQELDKRSMSPSSLYEDSFSQGSSPAVSPGFLRALLSIDEDYNGQLTPLPNPLVELSLKGRQLARASRDRASREAMDRPSTRPPAAAYKAAGPFELLDNHGPLDVRFDTEATDASCQRLEPWTFDGLPPLLCALPLVAPLASQAWLTFEPR